MEKTVGSLLLFPLPRPNASPFCLSQCAWTHYRLTTPPPVAVPNRAHCLPSASLPLEHRAADALPSHPLPSFIFSSSRGSPLLPDAAGILSLPVEHRAAEALPRRRLPSYILSSSRGLHRHRRSTNPHHVLATWPSALPLRRHLLLCAPMTYSPKERRPPPLPPDVTLLRRGRIRLPCTSSDVLLRRHLSPPQSL